MYAFLKASHLSSVALFAFFCLLLWKPLSVAGGEHQFQIEGVTIDKTLTVDGSMLHLTGAAVLTWGFLFDVYAGAFYLPEGTDARHWDSEVPRYLELNYFRSIAGEEFAESSDKLLRRNLDLAAYRALEERLQRLYSLFVDVEPGDRYALSYLPERGTTLLYNEKALGTIEGRDFAVAYFGLWIGPTPIDEGFRDELLGLD